MIFSSGWLAQGSYGISLFKCRTGRRKDFALLFSILAAKEKVLLEIANISH